MRTLLALLAVLALVLQGAGAVASPMSAPETGAEAAMAMDHHGDGAEPCTCCDDGDMPDGPDCIAMCVCPPVLTALPAAVSTLIVTPVVHDLEPVQRLESRGPSPPRRPPRLV